MEKKNNNKNSVETFADDRHADIAIVSFILLD